MLYQFQDGSAEIAAQARMIERFREILRIAAIALVQTHDIESRDPGLFGSAKDVAGFAGTLQTMHQHKRWVLFRMRLPMAFPANLRSRFHLELARFAI